jgi:hypothetical protein
MPQPRKGNWVVERLVGKQWRPYYSNLMSLEGAMKSGKLLHDVYRHRSFRIRQVKNGNVIMCDVF